MRYRFSLRTLFIWITVLGSLIGWSRPVSYKFNVQCVDGYIIFHCEPYFMEDICLYRAPDNRDWITTSKDEYLHLEIWPKSCRNHGYVLYSDRYGYHLQVGR